jgi:hypothetical protein
MNRMVRGVRAISSRHISSMSWSDADRGPVDGIDCHGACT